MIELIDVQNELVVMPEGWPEPATPVQEPPFYLPEKSPPPLPGSPRPLLRRPNDSQRPAIAWDRVGAGEVVSAKR